MSTNNDPSIEIIATKAGLHMNQKLKIVLLMLATLVSSGQLFAANAITGISYATVGDGATDIRLSFTSAPDVPAAFVTETPPRIAFDFADTNNQLVERRISVGSGATTAVSAVEAGGKTRVVIELSSKAEYSTRRDGNDLIVTVSDAARSVSASDASPTAAGAVSTRGAPASVNNVDFRRGPNGEGRVLVSFSRDNIGTDLRKEGNKIVVDVFDATVAESLPRRLDVTDFATPVSFIEATERPGGVRLSISTSGEIDHMAYQSGTDFIIEVSAVKPQEQQRRKLGDAPKYEGTPLTFNFQDIPVRSVLQLIADVSELNIVVADSVQGSVTTRLVNVPWDQALDIILQAKGLDKRRQGGVIWVAPTKEIAEREQALEDARNALEVREPLITEYIAVNYGKAKDMAALLTEDSKKAATTSGGGAATTSSASSNQGFLSPRGSVTFDERTNTLLINDIASKIKDVRDLIDLLDRPVDQVLIEARIVLADESFSRELGARFGVSGAFDDRNGNVVGVGGRLDGTSSIINQALSNRLAGGNGLPISSPPGLTDRLNVNLPVLSPAGSLGISVLGANYILDMELSALQTEGRGEVVSNPRVITANQREARITQNRQVAYFTEQQAGGGGGAGAGGGAVAVLRTVIVEFKDVILELKVVPTITKDDRVFLDLTVKKEQVESFLETPTGRVPNVATREVNTAVLIENGQTVVLGGVYEFNSREDLTKVPFLGDIPALGNLFKKKGKTSSKAELLIFVTPKILRLRGKEPEDR